MRASPGPLERTGVSTTIPLLAAFLLVSILEAVAGWLLWGGHNQDSRFSRFKVGPGDVVVPITAIGPFVAYPVSKTLWCAVDLAFLEALNRT